MFHLKYPRFRGFFAWDELGCLSRALGFPVDMFRSNVTDDIMVEDNGLPYKEVTRMLDFKHLNKALHLTVNLHTADWNTCVIRRSLNILDHHALSYEEIYNARVAYQAYETGDMKGMQINQHTLMRTLKMCNMTISPMKLMHRLKHSLHEYDEPGRIQLYEFLDLILWAHGYEEFTPDKTFGHFEMEDDLFKLKNFDELLSHHDQKLASRLDAQYLKDEWEFKKEKRGNRSKFRDPAVICGDSRVEAAHMQKETYKFLRSEIGQSQTSVHNTKSGCVRERPLTAPDLQMYKVREQMEYKRRQSQAAQQALYDKLQRLIKLTEPRDPGTANVGIDMTDKPKLESNQRPQNKPVVTEEEVKLTEERWQKLMFEVETEVCRHTIAMETEMEYYIPKYKESLEEKNQQVPASYPLAEKHKKMQKPPRSANQYEAVLRSLAYPVPHLPPSHAKKCDARQKLDKLQQVFRGWYGARSRKGAHFILMSPYFSNSPKGQLLKKLAKMSEEEIKKIHGDFMFRYTKTSDIDQRPVTAPAVLTEARSQLTKGHHSKLSRVSSGYGSMEEGDNNGDLETSPNKHTNLPDEYIVTEEHNADHLLQQHDEVKSGDLGHELEDHVKSKLTQESENTALQDFDSESCITSVTEKLKVLAEDQEENADSFNIHRRSKSAHGMDQGHKLFITDPYSRSQSAIGMTGKIPETSVIDIAPTPYMDHSKPKVISVGSIGKISLLESISEAKYWEDLAQKELEERRKLERDVLIVTHQNDDKGKEAEEDEEEQKDEFESGYGGGRKSVEVTVSSQTKIKQNEGKTEKSHKGKVQKQKIEDEGMEESGNIIEMLLQEERKRRKKNSRGIGYKPGQFHSGIRAARPSVFFSQDKTVSKLLKTRSEKSGNIPDHVTQSSKSKVKMVNNTDKQKKMITLEFQEKLPVGHDINQDKETRSDNQRRGSAKSAKCTKYDRLIKRMGEDISNHLAKRLMTI